MIEYVSLLLFCGYKGTLSRKWLIWSLWFLGYESMVVDWGQKASGSWGSSRELTS